MRFTHPSLALLAAGMTALFCTGCDDDEYAYYVEEEPAYIQSRTINTRTRYYAPPPPEPVYVSPRFTSYHDEGPSYREERVSRRERRTSERRTASRAESRDNRERSARIDTPKEEPGERMITADGPIDEPLVQPKPIANTNSLTPDDFKAKAEETLPTLNLPDNTAVSGDSDPESVGAASVGLSAAAF